MDSSPAEEGSSTGDVGEDTVLGEMISPCAMSREALPAGGFENQPPGKTSDEAVDSSLLRSLTTVKTSPTVSSEAGELGQEDQHVGGPTMKESNYPVSSKSWVDGNVSET